MSEQFLHTPIDETTQHSYKAFGVIYKVKHRSAVKYWLWGIVVAVIIILFLPWTQNIRAKGNVTTLRQEQRPQELNTIIAGRIEKWYIREGDAVKKGDTLVKLGEVKVDYFDPKLLERTQQQINAKELSISGYNSKAQAAAAQIVALKEAMQLKLNQLDVKIRQQQLKVFSDSTDVIAVKNEFEVTQRQIDAAKVMFEAGAISLVDFERRKVNFQNAQAKLISAENKFLQSRQELITLRIEKNQTVQDYTDKINKADGERYSALSNAASTEADVSKLENIYANYDTRNQLYYITAPQDGQVIKARKAGIGEMVKEGDMIVEIVPASIQYAVEMFVEPLDLPLIGIGQKVRFVFDGFPAIVFSGWPQASYGTFGGKVVAVETNVSDNGKFRVLVAEDANDRPWPKELRMGGGASGIALLKDVFIWYELWRNINGFPPDYYKHDVASKSTEGKKKK
ncbi:MAG: HlyD family secretion protein [Chitinophagaceae bacterium]